MMKIRHKKIVASGTAVVLAGILGVGALLQSSVSVQASPAMMPGIEQIVNDTTAEKPFKILEIVDDTSEAEIGYYVSGQEPYVKLYQYQYTDDKNQEHTITFDSLDPLTPTNTTVPVATDTTVPVETDNTTPTEGSNSGTTETVPAGVVLYGDVNLDGRVDVTDCVLLNKAVAGSVQLDTAANKNADCNGNGEISSDDATVLMQFIVNLVKTLPYNG